MKNGNGTMIFKVQKDELPDPNPGAARKYDWPFGRMKVGECFYFPLNNGDGVRDVLTVRGKIMQAAREHRAAGLRFTTRHLREKECIGVWRTK